MNHTNSQLQNKVAPLISIMHSRVLAHCFQSLCLVKLFLRLMTIDLNNNSQLINSRNNIEGIKSMKTMKRRKKRIRLVRQVFSVVACLETTISQTQDSANIISRQQHGMIRETIKLIKMIMISTTMTVRITQLTITHQ